MPLILREEKGSQLTFSELDGNFTYLEGLIPNTSSFATTGSNIFRGNQTITGSFAAISGSGDLTSSIKFTHTTIAPDQGSSVFEVRHNNNAYSENIALKLFADDVTAKMQYEKDGSTVDVMQMSLNNNELFLLRDTRVVNRNLIVTGSLLVTGSANIVGNQSLSSGSLLVTGSSIFSSPSYGNGIGANNSGSRFTQNTTTVSMVIKPSGSANFGNISVSDNNDSTSTVNLYGSTLLIGNTSANTILFGNASSNTNLLGTYNFRAGATITGSLLVTGSANINGLITYPQVSASLNFVDDAAAASGGVPLGGLYRSGSFVLIRLV